MKVRILVASVNAGAGTARSVIHQANALARLHDVEIVSLHARGSGPAFPVSPQVRVRYLVDTEARWPRLAARLPSRLVHPKDVRHRVFSPASDLALWRFLRSLESGAVMGTRPGLNLAIARWAPTRVTRIAQEHMQLAGHRPGLRRAIRTYYPRLDGVVTLTERDAQDYRRLLREATPVTAIPNGVELDDTRRSDPAARSVVAVGRLTAQKGFDRLIDAFGDVAGSETDWSLTIVGRGEQRRQLVQQIERRGLADRVRLTGFVPDVAAELAGASVFAMSSRREGLPMAMLEAMASGLAIVSFDCPTGPRELVEDGTDGLLVPENDVPALAAALARVMADEQLRGRLGTAARVKAAAYSTDQLALRWSRLLQAAEQARATRVVPRPGRYYPMSWRPLPRRLRRARRRVRVALRAPAQGTRRERGRPAMTWKRSVNATLVRATGYRLVRAAPSGAGGGRTDRSAATAREAAGPAPGPDRHATPALPKDFDADAVRTIEAVRAWTMTGPEKVNALILAVRYVARHQIPGDIVECGVWRGGSMQAVARTLIAAGDTSRDLYLFDTFEGMPPPSEDDRRHDGRAAADLLASSSRTANVWAVATLDDVRTGMSQVGYPAPRVHYVPGLVEDTVPGQAPEQISILRLDTDWYASTRHELETLYPRLVSGGVLLLDDYGWWQGARKAVDEFLDATGERLLLLRMGSGRIAVKP